jgi:hypothetical protein
MFDPSFARKLGIVSQLLQQHQRRTKAEKRKENSVVVVVGEGGNPSVALTSGTWPIRATGLLLLIQFL